MDDLDVNVAIWGIFLFATLRAAVHLGQDYEANLWYVKKNLWNSVGQLFNETGKLISEQKEITGVSTIKLKDDTWMSTSLLCEKAYQITNAKAYVFSDSVLCVGKMGEDPSATWKSKIKWHPENNHFKDMNRIDGMPTEFEWKIFPGITTLGPLEKIQSLMRDPQCKPEHFKDRIIFMSMYNNIAWREKGSAERFEHNSQTVSLVSSLAVIGLSWNLDQKRNGTEPTPTNPTDLGIEWQKKWCKFSQIPIIQYFLPWVPLREVSYEAKEGERSQYTSTVVMKT